MDGAETVLNELLNGNEKFRMKEDPRERERLAKGQSPKAAVLYCSDSREVAEMLLGCERRGEIFGIRLAGNVATKEAIGSIIYAVEHLHVPLVMVLGHTGCGAVAAVKKGGRHEDADLEALLSQVEKDEEINVRKQIERIRANKTVAERLAGGKVKLVGAIHDMGTGKIRILE